MSGHNSHTIVGNLVADPETLYSATGTPITKFRMAVSRDFKREGDPDTDFFSVVTFGKLADVCGEHLVKGKQVLVEGRHQNRQYQNDAGETKYASEINANSMKMLGKKDS